MDRNVASPEPELETLFHEAAALKGAARETFLDRACACREELRRQLDRLLAAHDSEGSLGPGEGLAADFSGEVQAGDQIGRYRVLERLGEGGCGAVFMAEQLEPIRRRVALKVIKAGMDSRAVIARYEAERQALALMDHPHIARVFDAGTTGQGRPYFVMELVRGRRITEHCDHFKLPPRERLALFTQVCQAVQHAHQKGIIHRDLKPSNVLVSIEDGSAIPTVIDFGIAKAAGQPLTEKTLATGHDQLLGTPAYMSPEQAEYGNLDVDTRSDIYSLGIMLYELLAGSRPIDANSLAKSGLDEIRRRIREEEPPKPSDSVAALPEPERRAAAKARGIDPQALKRELAGDLDWIVMKCLEKERSRRYQTASGLAEDLQHHLRDEPVGARPPSAAYRFRKLIRRHRAAAAASTAGLVAALAAAAAVFWQWRTSEAFRDLADRHNYVASLNFARQLVQSGDVSGASVLLQELPERLRGWEWGRLMQEARQDLLSIPMFTNMLIQAPVPECSLSDDGARLVIFGGGIAQAVNVRDGKIARTFGGPGDPISSARFSPDGGMLLLAGGERGWELWDAAAWTLSRSNAFPARSICFSPDGSRFATCDGAKAAIWDAATGARVRELALKKPVFSLEFSRDGTRLFSRSAAPEPGASAFIWDAADGELIAEVPPVPGNYTQAVVANSADRYATVDARGVAACWTVGRSRPDFETPRQGPSASSILRVEASPDLPRLALIRAPGQLHIWDCEAGFELGSAGGLSYALWPSPDGRTLLACDLSMQMRALDWKTGQEQRRISGGRPGLGVRAAFSGNSRFIAATAHTGAGESLVQVFPLPGSDKHFADSGKAFRFALSPDGSRGAIARIYGGLSVWDIASGRQLGVLRGHTRWVSDVFWGPDGKRLYSGSADKTVRIWDAGRFAEIRRFTNALSPVTGIAVSPDEKLLAATDAAGWVRVWRPAEGDLLWSRQVSTNSFRDPHGPWPLSFSPDGQWLEVRSLHAQAGVWDAKTGTRALQYSDRDDFADLAAGTGWSPDGSELAVCDFSGGLRFWETGSWRLRRTARARRPAFQVAYSAGGDRLFLATSESGDSGEGVAGVDVYDPRSGQFLARLGERQGNSLSVELGRDDRRLAWCLWANRLSGQGVYLWEALPWRDRDYPGTPGEPLAERISRLARERLWDSIGHQERFQSAPPEAAWREPREEWPARRPETPAKCVDLTEHYNAHLNVAWQADENWEHQENDLSDLPQGLVNLAGIQWDIRGIISLGFPDAEGVNRWPGGERVSGIRIGRKCKRLHFLHAAVNLWAKVPSIGRYVLRYNDGTSCDLALQPGVDIGNWWSNTDLCAAAAGEKAWQGENPVSAAQSCRTALFHRAWENPFPGKEIMAIDFVSEGGEAAPFLVAITLDP
jgi:serine/threonine protein kinase/WD40 repeat protein